MSKKELETKKKSGVGKFILGALVGAGLGVLFAPKAGSETRKDLKNKMTELLNKAKEIDIEFRNYITSENLKKLWEAR